MSFDPLHGGTYQFPQSSVSCLPNKFDYSCDEMQLQGLLHAKKIRNIVNEVLLAFENILSLIFDYKVHFVI